jgi:phage-related protein
MEEIRYYLTPTGNCPYEEFKKELVSKRKTVELYICDWLIKDLGEQGTKLILTKELKFLDKKYKLYELKKLGKKVRIGVYLCSIEGHEGFLILGGFLKESSKTPQSEIELLRKRIKSYKERTEK